MKKDTKRGSSSEKRKVKLILVHQGYNRHTRRYMDRLYRQAVRSLKRREKSEARIKAKQFPNTLKPETT